MRKRIILIILVITILSITGCGSDTTRLENKIDQIVEKLDSQSQEKALQKQLDNANDQISDLQEQVDSDSSTNFINIKFWQDGKRYKVYDEEFQFYSDCFCSKRITDVIIKSSVIDELELSNDIKVYAVLSNKGIIYSPNYPSLEEIKE